MNTGNQSSVDALPPKKPSSWLIFVIAILLVVGPFTSPNGLWFCWSCSGSLTYIYINLLWRYRKWENEQIQKQALREEEKQQQKKAKKSRVWDKSESKKQK